MTSSKRHTRTYRSVTMLPGNFRFELRSSPLVSDARLTSRASRIRELCNQIPPESDKIHRGIGVLLPERGNPGMEQKTLARTRRQIQGSRQGIPGESVLRSAAFSTRLIHTTASQRAASSPRRHPGGLAESTQG